MMRNILCRWCALALLAMVSFQARSATDTSDAQIDVLTGTTVAPTAAAILHADYDRNFRLAPHALVRAPDDHSAWYRLQLSKDWTAASAPLLALHGLVRARLVVYLPPAYLAHAVNPYAADVDPRFSRHGLVFELPRDLRADQPIYLETGKPGQTQPMKAGLVDYATYQAEDLRHVRISVLFASVQMAMLLVTLCFWLILRDRVLLYFIAYVAAQLVYLLAANGELYAMPGAALLAPLGFHPGQFAAIVSAALSISFILEFAELPHHVPVLARLLSAMRWPYFAFAIALWLPWLQPDRWLPNVVNALLVLSTFTALVAAWRAWRHGSRQAGFFLISWLPLLCLTVVRVAQLIFGLPLPSWLEYAYPASMAYAAVVITVGLADRTLQARRERDIAYRLADLDPLTSVLNRRAVLDRLQATYADAREAHRALAVLFIDLDHFKQINDKHGHRTGDRVLNAVAVAMQDELRELDSLGRYGGEEFLVVLPGAAERAAGNVAERIRENVAELAIQNGASALRQTVSIGFALLDETTPTVETLIEHADIALYRAKAQGRNCVVYYAPSTNAAPALAS